MAAAALSSDTIVVFLKIEGMMCQNNCGTTVHNALQSVMGVKSVKVSFPSATATVTLTESCSSKESLTSDLIESVENVGFDACVLSTTEPSFVLTIMGMMCQKNCGTTVRNALLAVSASLPALLVDCDVV